MSLRMSPKSSSTVEAFETNGTRPRHRRPARLKKDTLLLDTTD